MNKLDEVFDKLVSQEQNGSYKVNRLTLREIDEIPDFIVYDSQLSGETYNFKGNKFRPNKTEKRLVIDTFPIFEFEVKIIFILLAKRGTKLGGVTKRFSTSTRIIKELIRFSNYLNSRGYESFHDLSCLPKFKFNDVVSSYVNYRQGHGQSTVGVVKDSLNVLLELNFLNQGFSKGVIEANTKSKRNKADTINRLKHPLVAPMIQKKIISECNDLFKSKKDIKRFITLGNKVNANLEAYALKNPNMKSAILSILPKMLSKDEVVEYRALRKKIKRITPYAFTMVLALTGLRVSEGKAIKNNSHRSKREKGKVKYFIESTLRKYTNEDVVLDWVSCKQVFDAMTLLSDVNNVYYDRINLIIKYYPSKISEKNTVLFQEALKNNYLFGFNYASQKGNLWFPKPSNPVNTDTSGQGATVVALDLIKVQVTESDINFLEKYKCNYKSVSANSGMRGVKYKVGDIFRLTPHMLRHSFAWFIIANKLGDVHHISQQFKHMSEMVTFVYAQRGFEAIDDLRNLIEGFDALLTEEAITDIVESAMKGEIGGGGGKRLKNIINKLNKGQSGIIFSTDHQEHIESIQELIALATKNSDGILGLPHGYCAAGSNCKMHNVAVPDSCIYCYTYFATRRHLPFWTATKNSAEQGISRIMDAGLADRYQAFLSVLKRTLASADKAISDIEGNGTKEVYNG
ncbi:hypothetical protein CGJ94_18380 [Vibrio parahaemolyticus]|uniref:hypothetical protein n=1 Tax=Vibrio parahaemolyticus TaxID=670 RepID=UPI001122E54C|nr:hypothetical protein [Vibrio parahaemolyticus]TOB38039.1 hypothetical protein CGK06_24095 [Vibrio parahaemolyticus]TOC15984.1 hypothetical protein CGJ94_18380 [Vibrio parahaemolyticus]